MSTSRFRRLQEVAQDSKGILVAIAAVPCVQMGRFVFAITNCKERQKRHCTLVSNKWTEIVSTLCLVVHLLRYIRYLMLCSVLFCPVQHGTAIGSRGVMCMYSCQNNLGCASTINEGVVVLLLVNWTRKRGSWARHSQLIVHHVITVKIVRIIAVAVSISEYFFYLSTPISNWRKTDSHPSVPSQCERSESPSREQLPTARA